jgi:saccharopine dehydrogenase (NAD+, L-lysine-forming)
MNPYIKECKKLEYRTPLTPENAKKLLNNGFKVKVEKSKSRIFPNEGLNNKL